MCVRSFLDIFWRSCEALQCYQCLLLPQSWAKWPEMVRLSRLHWTWLWRRRTELCGLLWGRINWRFRGSFFFFFSISFLISFLFFSFLCLLSFSLSFFIPFILMYYNYSFYIYIYIYICPTRSFSQYIKKTSALYCRPHILISGWPYFESETTVRFNSSPHLVIL